MKLIGLIGRARSGKDTVGEYLYLSRKYANISFARPIKDMLSSAFREVNFWSGDREEIIPWLGKSPRQLMQTLGTEWGRQLVHPDLWVLLLQQEIKRMQVSNRPGCIVTDVRFPNEAKMILEQGGELWRINREITDQVNPHISEEFRWDEFQHTVIDNNGTLQQLYSQVDSLILGKTYNDLIDRVRQFSGEESPSLCNCDHKLQGTGAVFYQSLEILQCNTCRGWQHIRKPIK